MKKKKNKNKITVADYIKAVKKADREIQINQNTGWQRSTKVHKSKKTYDRKKEKSKFKTENNGFG